MDWRNSWAVADNSQESARMVDPAEVRTPAADVEIKEMKTSTVTAKIMNMKTLSSFLTTESRSFNEAVMDFLSRPISTQTASNSSIVISPFMSLSNMLKAASASSSFWKAFRRSS